MFSVLGAKKVVAPLSQKKHRKFHDLYSVDRGEVPDRVAASADRDQGAQRVHKNAPRPYIISPVWRGEKRGYFFSRGLKGQGYYADSAQGDRWKRYEEHTDEATGDRDRRQQKRGRSPERGSDRQPQSRPPEREGAAERGPRRGVADGTADESKLEANFARRAPETGLTAEERQAAALARLAEKRARGSSAGNFRESSFPSSAARRF